MLIMSRRVLIFFLNTSNNSFIPPRSMIDQHLVAKYPDNYIPLFLGRSQQIMFLFFTLPNHIIRT